MTTGNPWRGPSGTPISAVGEFGLIHRLRTVLAEIERGHDPYDSYIVVGIGDDTAVLSPTSGQQTLVTCDIQVAGRHFVPAWTTPRELGMRCAAVNLSDIGAMGGLPRAAIVSLAIGPQIAVEDLEELYRGMGARLLEHGARLVGGNVSGLADGFVIDVTLLGEVESGGAVRRDTAAPGDIVWVTGAPGSSAAGLGLLQANGGARPPAFEAMVHAYLRPTARPREGRALGTSGAVSAMIDLSDGLIGDLTHMVETRPIGIMLREEALPIGDPLVAAAAAIGRTPISLLLGASDDYELIFTTPPDKAEQAIRALRSVSDVAAWPIGEVIASAPGQVLIEDRQGRRHAAGARGWDHFESR
jgi:thiamine-monophosphate kinase